MMQLIPGKWKVLAWELYDLSDTVFSGAVLTFYFPLWLTIDIGHSHELFALALSASMILVVATAPLFGSVSDQLHRKLPLLAIAVVLCGICTALIGVFGGIVLGIALFMLANFMYQTGIIFHNSLIFDVSDKKNRGIVSGIGVSSGFVGLLVVFVALEPVIETYGTRTVFIPIAALYMLSALPLLLTIREGGSRHLVDLSLIRDSYRELYETFHRARKHGNFFRFITSRFLYTEAINTVALFLVIYTIEVGGVTEHDTRWMIIASVVAGAVSAFITGIVVSRTNPKIVLMVGLVGWLVIVAAATLATESWMFWLIVPATGVLWAPPQISDRVLLTELAPRGQEGEFFGLFQIAGRRAALIGPAIWLTVSWALHDTGEMRFRIAVLIVGLMLIPGILLLAGVRERREESDLLAMDSDLSDPLSLDQRQS